MGMFDTISVSDALPFTAEMKELGLDINNYQFQTKSLDSLMDSYIIQGGKLFIQKYKNEHWIEGDKNAKKFTDRFGRIEREEPYLEPVLHHGEIYFYDYKESVQNKWDCWVEFKAVFTSGVVDRYELVEFRKTDNTERLESQKKYLEEIKEQENKWYNKYFLYTKPVRWFGHRVWYRGWHRLGNVCHNLSNKIF